ncbi:MAG: TetR/AcrR family transcriptional regulator [Actinobacteria bacterium]|nr:TetR/AcrR family transcriptional regulator [Actinomycetota bacterium]
MKVPPPDLARRLVEQSERILGDDPPPRLEDVARMVGVSRASLYYYFAGRDDLVALVLTAHARAGAEFALARDDATAPPVVRLRAVLLAMVEYLGERPAICAGMLAAAGGGPRLAEALAVNDRWVAAPLRALVSDGVARGAFDVGTPDDPTAVTDVVNGMLGALLFAVLGRTSVGGHGVDDGFRQRLVEQVLTGIAGTPDR